MTIPITERTDRKGNGKMRINDIWFENDEGIKVSELISGLAYTLKLGFDRHNEVSNKQCNLVMQFKDDNDQLVNTMATDELGTSLSEIPETGFFQVSIPKLQFRSGSYSMSFMLSEKLSLNTEHIPMDFIADAIKIKVERGDYWNSGFINRPNGFIQEASIIVSANR